MQRNPFSSLKRRAAVIAFALLACAGARAAELGEASVRSYIGQPLVADIELNALAADEIGRLQVRLASPEVYRGANIRPNPALQTLNLSLVRREQRHILHITSLQKIDAEYLHLFLELSAGGRGTVRAITVWLVPNPNPAPLPALMPTPTPMPVSVSVPAPAPLPDTTQSHAPAAVAHRAPRPIPHAASVATPAPLQRPALPVLPPLQKAVAACAPAAQGEARQCVALERKNAALTSKLVELEGKIKILQQALLPGQAASALAGPALPKLKPLAVVKPAPVEPAPARSSALWWFGGGAAALLLLIGLVVHLVRRRKKTSAPSIPAVPRAPSKYWVLLRRPFSRKKAAAAPDDAAVEPVLE